jgi:hypothetical protein
MDVGDELGAYVSAHYGLGTKRRGMIDVDSPFLG